MEKYPLSFYENDAIYCARNLLGSVISIRGKSLIITQTEAYLNEEDKASHARFGRTKRSSILYEKGGILYVYMIYGIHLMANVVVNKKDFPSAVLLRNGMTFNGEMIQGPGRLCKYLGIITGDNNTSLTDSNELFISPYLDIRNIPIIADKRIGVNYAEEWAEKPLRFSLDRIDKQSILRTP